MTDGGRIEVRDTQRPVADLVVHVGCVVEGEIRADAEVTLAVDVAARDATVRNHSGTHLLHAALREVLGPQAMQKGSLVSPDRLRFDFTHDAPVSPDELREIEDRVNAWIEANAPARVREMGYQDAIASGAVAIFEEKYGDEVRVVSFGDFSTELCGGTHAGATGDIGMLKIVSESGIAAGVRRLEALTGLSALRHMRNQERALAQTAQLLKAPLDEVPARVEKLVAERRAVQREIEQLKASQLGSGAGNALGDAREIEGGKALATRVDGADAKAMRQMTDDLRNRLGSGVVMLVAESEGKVLLAIGVTKDLVSNYKAGDLVRETAKIVGGGGGGRPDFAQAGGKDASKIEAAIEKFYSLVGGA
jgi:alanyl-tRNA synthetase